MILLSIDAAGLTHRESTVWTGETNVVHWQA